MGKDGINYETLGLQMKFVIYNSLLVLFILAFKNYNCTSGLFHNFVLITKFLLRFCLRQSICTCDEYTRGRIKQQYQHNIQQCILTYHQQSAKTLVISEIIKTRTPFRQVMKIFVKEQYITIKFFTDEKRMHYIRKFELNT